MIYSKSLNKYCQPKIVCLEKLSVSFNSEWEASEAQDGRVGHVLTTSYENTRITSNCWTTIGEKKKKKIEATKKLPYIQNQRSHNEMVEEAQSWWKQILYLLDGWQTGKQLCHRSSLTGMKVLSPTSGLPAWGVGNRRRSPQRICLWRPPRFDHRISQDWGK